MVDPKKVIAVKKWPKPTTPNRYLELLGSSQFYRRFMESFSTIASLLTKLTQKRSSFVVRCV